jgi:predicted nucleic acid-binding Zn ribbon protein
MDEAKQLRNILTWRMRQKLHSTTRLSDVVVELLDNRISPTQVRFSSIVQLWNELLPAELARHCRLVDISGGQLKVLVDSPVYMYELRLCSRQLLDELQRRCPRARIKDIKSIIG